LTRGINARDCHATNVHVQDKKIIRSATESASRLAGTRTEVAAGVDSGNAVRHIQTLTKPNSLSKTMRKVGVGLVAAPDPITTVAGAALITGSYMTKRKDPVGLTELAAETRKILRDMQSLTL
jgi:hypothetical protein